MTSFLRRCLPLLVADGLARAERVEFRTPHRVAYDLEARAAAPTAGAWADPAELVARPVGGGKPVRIQPRVVLRLTDTNALASLAVAHGLVAVGRFDGHTFLLTAPGPRQAARAASALAALPGVEAAGPVLRRQVRKHFAYGSAANDPYFSQQNYLEAPATNAPFLSAAPDLNVRGAWAYTRGAGIIVALADDGMEAAHPDLAANASGPHHNFFTGTASSAHDGLFNYHGTEVAGLIAARGGNQLGLSGTAPRARLAGWVIFNSLDDIPDDAGMAAMFSFALNGPEAVAVQNHSWGNSDFDVLEMSLPEQIAIANATGNGRHGLGVVLVRSAGNTRSQDYSFNLGVGDANLDAYASDIHQLTVAAVRNDGRVSSYSTPGACVLLAAMGGEISDPGSPGLVTTDRVGSRGANTTPDSVAPNSWDYAFGRTGFVGTSAAAPLVSGVAALVLSANPQLGWRDVQQVLVLAARHLDRTDPDRTTNGAGFVVSHNVGFGIPDAGTAVRLALAWSNRPPAVELRYTNALPQNIPDDGLRVQLTGSGVPPTLTDLAAGGTVGLHPDAAGLALPLEDVGQLGAPPGKSLTGRAALITHGAGSYAQEINFAAQAGAAFAVVVNNSGSTEHPLMRGTDFVPIRAVQIGRTDGTALRSLLATQAGVPAALALRSATYALPVAEALVVEHVQVRLNWSHPRMADLRVTLRSPAGTLSLLHRPGASVSAVPSEWTYSSVHHLGESSLGTWTVAITDEEAGSVGTVSAVELILTGVPITDTDADGLDDHWELAHFGSLAWGPRDDPDHDGWNNAAEQLRGSDPMVNETPLRLDLTTLSPGRARLSWPGLDGTSYEVLQGRSLDSVTQVLMTVPGHFPESGVLLPFGATGEFFRIHAVP